MHVAIIGAGVAGLTTAKSMLEQGLRVQLFERAGQLGGIWHFREGPGGVHEKTFCTSSKQIPSFLTSRFPMIIQSTPTTD